jgi:hypothetical protein
MDLPLKIGLSGKDLMVILMKIHKYVCTIDTLSYNGIKIC